MVKYFLSTILILLAFSAGCLSPDVNRSEEGVSRLDRLRGGMSLPEVVGLLGPATAAATIRESPRSGEYRILTYTNTLINPGVVELIFDPDLSEIRRDGRLYRDLGGVEQKVPPPR